MIYADENVWLPVVEGLRRRGWSVTTAREEGTLGESDEEQLRYATEHGWSVLTFDDDFLAVVESRSFDDDHPGVIYISQHARNVGEPVGRIDEALQRNDDRDLTNRVVYA